MLKAKDNMAAMGETGAGIESEAEIGTGTALSTKWGGSFFDVVKYSC